VPMANVSPLLPGDPGRLGGYRLAGRIGQGGQGTVFLAWPPSGEPVAVKLLHAEWTRDPLARARFAREVAAVRRVAPFCTARVLAAHLDGDEPFVVSEFIDGPSLHEVVARDGPLAGSALDRLAVGTATALSAIHQAGVIHRDFKPANVLMGPDGPRVIDFGIARPADTTATLSSQMFGTPGYIAPEVVRGQPAGLAADVFAWGATIGYAATGASPFQAPNVAAVVHRLTRGEPDLGPLHGDLRAVVAGCLAKDPGARPTAIEVLMRLLRDRGDGGPRPRHAPVADQAAGKAAWQALHRTGGHGAAGWAVVIAGAVALGVLGRLLVPVLVSGPSAGDAPGGPARPANAIPSWFAGTWRGRADQADGVVKRWDATLVLPPGVTAGTFTITTIGCHATTTVTEVTQTRLVLRETAAPDSARQCAASGVISLDRTGARRARMSWQDSEDPGNGATGTFLRR